MVYTTPHRVREGSRTTLYDLNGKPKYLGTIRSIRKEPEGILIVKTYCKEYQVKLVNQP